MFQQFYCFMVTLVYCVCFVALEGDSRYLSTEEQNRELTRSILREVGKLSEQWNNLIDRSDHWKHRLDEYMTVSEIHSLSRIFVFFCRFALVRCLARFNRTNKILSEMGVYFVK